MMNESAIDIHCHISTGWKDDPAHLGSMEHVEAIE